MELNLTQMTIPDKPQIRNQRYIKKLFYNLPLIFISWTGLVITLIFGTLCMIISNLPNWIGAILCFAILRFSAIAVIKAKLTADLVDEIDTKIKAQTQFIKLLIADAEHLMSSAKTVELKTEAIRYFDPVSNDVLSNIEKHIQDEFSAFTHAVKSENLELAKAISETLFDLIDIRNKQCKLLK